MRTTTTMKARLTCLLLALIMVFSMIPLGVFTAFAADGTPSYVALGDSISTGYGLEGYTVGTVPTNSFTYLLADGMGYELTNLAVDGNTAAGILAQLSNDTVKTAVTNADLITVTAGGNDLMAVLYQAIADQYNKTQTNEANKITAAQVPVIFSSNDSRKMSLMNFAMGLLDSSSDIYLIDDQEFTNAVAAYIATLNQVTAGILAENPDATVIVATQYNPYVEFNGASYPFIIPINLTPIYSGMEAGVAALNTAIKNNAATGKYIVADVKAAFDAYTGTGDLYNADPTSLNIDFHPTAAGHAIIADTFAAAIPMPEVYVGGVGMADGTYLANGAASTTTTAPASGGYAYYKDGTLTLNNYSYSGAGYVYDSYFGYTSVIYSPDALNIVLQGENAITNTENSGDGITVKTGLTISGSGGIDITADYGVYVDDNDITISGGSIDITADYGILVSDGDFTINDGTLNINAGYGISNDYGSVNFNGGTTTIDASGGFNTVYVNGDIIFKDGMEILEPSAAEIETDKYGCNVISDSNGDTDIKVVIGASGTTPPTPSAVEIYVGGVGMADGTYLANGATATTTTAPASSGYAHYKDGTLTLNNYSYSGAGEYGIYSEVALNIVLQGENSIAPTADGSDGISVEAALTISGSGRLDITSTHHGIYLSPIDSADITINGGTLNIAAEHCIVNDYGSVNFNGGTITVDASGIWGSTAVFANGNITLGDGMEILEPTGAEIGTEEFGGKVVFDSDGNTDIKVVIGASGTTPPTPSAGVYVGGVGMADGTYLANGAIATTTTAPSSGGYAYYNDGVLTLNNYEYEGEGYWYDSDYTSVIYSPNALNIVLQGENAITNTEDNCDGINVDADLTISGSGGIVITSDYGILAYNGDITVSGGIIDIIPNVQGISCYGTVTFSGGTTTIDASGGYDAVSAIDAIIFTNVEILEPEGADIEEDSFLDCKYICDSKGNSNIKVVIGTKSAAPEALTGTVNITGDMQIGSTLTATVTDTNNTGELSYQWYRYVENNTAIVGATSSTYTLTADDITYGIFCVVSSSVQTGSVQGYASGAVKKKEIGISWGNTSFTYNGSAQKPSATATGVLNNDSIMLTVEVSGESVNAGEYTATVTGITGVNAGNYRLPSDVTINFAIGKADQNKPTVSKTDETITNKKDGTISGVDTTMEYRKDGETTYTAISGDNVSNLAAGKYYVRLKGDSNHNPSDDTEVTIAAGGKLAVTVPQNQIGYTMTASKTALEWHGSTTLAFALADGYSKTNEFSVSAAGATLTDNGNGTYTISNAEANVTVTVNGVADTTAPEAEISISTNTWTQFLNNITFGLFFKETQDITITATDAGSGLDKIYYYISETALTEDEVKALAADKWTEYDASNKPSIDPDKKCIVYAKITDKAQNSHYISSNGLVFDGAAPVIDGIENGKDYYGDVEFSIADALAGVKEIKVDGNTVTLNEGKYTITADNAEHTVVATDKAGNKTEYKITVYKVYEITFKHPTFETGFPVNYGVSFNEAHPDTVQDMIASKDYHTFIGWYESTDGGNTLKDTPYDFNAEVMGDVTLYPLFEIYTYTVTYKADGEVIGTVEVEHGTDATAPDIPEKEGYTQTAPIWDKDGKNITADTEINAVYTINEYTVTFMDENGVYQAIKVKHGEKVTMPEAPKKDGYTVKWETTIDKATGNATVKAVYTEIPATDKPSSPQTGDNSNMALWIALLFISGGAVITLTVYDKKRRNVAKR